MDHITAADLASLRAWLTRRADALLAEVRAAEHDSRPSDTPSVEVTDRKDVAARKSADTLHAAEERRDLNELALVRFALARLDNDTYGRCVDCGEPIALARLRVQPAASRCTGCQAKSERG